MDYPLLYSFAADVGSNVPPNKHAGVSCLSFDTEQEILWTGNYTGHVTSFAPMSPASYNGKYTSFHVDHESDIRQLSTCREGVCCLTKNGFRLYKRRGFSLLHSPKRLDLFQDLQCMLLTTATDARASQLYLAGAQEKLIQYDVEADRLARVVDIWEDDNKKGIQSCSFIKGHPRFICLADTDGKVVLRDHNQLRIQNEIKLTAKISSFDILGNYLVTCSALSQLLMIYDLREMKLVSATQAYLPIHVKFLSRYTTKCVVVSHSGQFSTLDILHANNLTPMNNVALPYGSDLTCFDISSTNQAFAFGDTHNGVHLHATCGDISFNSSSIQPEYDDAILNNNYYPLLSDLYTPISAISPFPYIAVPKVSDFRYIISHIPTKETMRCYRQIPPVPQELLGSMRMVGNIGFVANASGLFPSLVNGNRNSPDSNAHASNQIPHRYQFLEPNHNKVEMEQYDFSRYNNSPFPGLDSTMPNSYANNIIQCLYFIPQLRSAILEHLCTKDCCLLCELSFLFHMLDFAPTHAPCQASNFLRAFRSIPEAFTLKLILTEDERLSKQYNLFNQTQQWFRFVLYQLSRASSNNNNNTSNNQTASDVNSAKSTKSFVDQYFPLIQNRRYQCSKCHGVWEKPGELFPLTLNCYPSPKSTTEMMKDSTSPAGAAGSAASAAAASASEYVSFAELLTKSMVTEQSFQSNCEKCLKFHNVKEKRTVLELPQILVVNTGFDNERAIDFWKEQNNLFIKKMAEKGLNIVTSYKEFQDQNKPQEPVTTIKTEQHKQQLSFLQQQMKKPCRFMEKCNKSDCKFYHANLEEKVEPVVEEKKEFASYIPGNLFILNDPQAFKISENIEDFSEEEKPKLSEYILVNVSSIVENNETRVGNVVSAIKIDKSYFNERKRQVIRKKRRVNGRSNQPVQREMPEKKKVTSADEMTDYSEDESLSLDDHDLFTNESRNAPKAAEFEKCLALYKKKNEWYLFNHYSVNPIDFEEVLSIDLEWKKPTILMYMNKQFAQKHDNYKEMRRKKNPIDENVLLNDHSIANRFQQSSSVVPLDLTKETIMKGDIVGMDAEFVMLNHGETELRSDGTRVTMKPSHKSVARISCVRGSGPLKGSVFLDDYISNHEVIVDYMTKYSGIQPGDLDPTQSTKHVTTLKSTYLKLRFLADRGVIFVGHGLRNDFRVINLIVPPEQVIDTVYLFQSYKSKRMVSLRFLAYYFLNMNIQSDTHDSIEDANTALLLYQKYKEMEANGTHLDAIDELYEFGKSCGWKVADTMN